MSFIYSVIQYLHGVEGSGYAQCRDNCQGCQLFPTFSQITMYR